MRIGPNRTAFTTVLAVAVVAATLSAPRMAIADGKRFLFPVGSGYLGLSSHFGWRRGRPHLGTDFEARSGSPIHAAAAGLVSDTGYDRRCGHFVKLRHGGGWETVYCHLKVPARKSHGIVVGRFVGLMEAIGLVGSTGRSTGPHLHFAVKRFGRFLDPTKVTFSPRETFRIHGNIWARRLRSRL